MYPGQMNTPPSTLQDPLRIPRRQMDPEDIIEIARRNKGWIAAPMLAGLVIAVVVAFLWPDTYVSTAVIRVVPPQVPERLVSPIVNSEMSERIQSMAQTILSRGTLTSIIETHGLYPRQRKQLPMEDIVEDMNGAIRISPVTILRSNYGRGEDLTAFQVSFAYENRYLAQKVAGEITTRFITENQRERHNQSATTTQFLRDELQMAKNQLDEIEQQRTDFQIRHAGQLPDQWPIRMQQLATSEARISTLNGTISRLNQDKLVLEGEMRLLRDEIQALMRPGNPVTAAFTDPNLAGMDNRIADAERQVRMVLETYKPNHPDVERLQSQINAMRKERERYISSLEAQSEGDDEAAAPQAVISEAAAGRIRDLNSRINSLELQKRTKDMQIEDATAEINRINERNRQLQAQVESAPVGQQEYVELMRDYDLAKRRYDDLNLKMSQSEIATNLEQRKQSETLELLDAPNLPTNPSEPKREFIILGGVAAGIGVGCMLVFLLEVKDTTLKTLKDVRAYTQLVVLGSVPLLENDLVMMRRRRMAWLGWTAASLASAVVMAGAVYYYYVTKV